MISDQNTIADATFAPIPISDDRTKPAFAAGNEDNTIHCLARRPLNLNAYA